MTREHHPPPQGAWESSTQPTLFACRNVSIADNSLQKWVHMPPKMTGYIPSLQSPKLTPADTFTELWLCNPALGLAGPERVLSSLRGSPEPPWRGGPITGPSSRGIPSFGPSSRAPRSWLLLPGESRELFHGHRFGQSPLPGVQSFPFKLALQVQQAKAE